MKIAFFFFGCLLLTGCCKLICDDISSLTVSFEKFKAIDTDTHTPVVVVEKRAHAQHDLPRKTAIENRIDRWQGR